MAQTLLRRRGLLGAGAALFGAGFIPRIGTAQGGGQGADPRFLTVILRGALDGLSAVPAIGDPAYAAQRGRLSLEGASLLPAGNGFFAFNPRLPKLHALYQRGEALVLHAVATPYRERSHFDGQDVLESGLERPGGRDGWMNRAIQALPAGERLPPPPGTAANPRGLAIAPTAPLIMRGPAPVFSWAPQFTQSADEDTLRRILSVYDARDPALAAALRTGAQLDLEADARPSRGRGGPEAAGRFAELAGFAASRLARPDGPRLAVLGVDGWDTHAMQGPVQGRLGNLLARLDEGIGALEEGLRPVWRETAVLLVTEFGRTVRVNGTDGTDHGTGTVAFLIGGAVRGGRIVADWPGLADAALLQGRDLRPTMDLRAAVKGVLAEQFGLSPRVLAEQVFPGSARVAPVAGLIRT
jgi:uncharacterized protein (DUF1501 family)